MKVSDNSIVLVGAGGHSRSVIDVIEQDGRYEIYGLVDVASNIGSKVLGYEVIAGDEELPQLFSRCANALVTVGHIENNTLRVRLYQTLKKIGYFLPVLVSPLAYVSKYAELGEGTVVMHHALVNTNAKVGRNCIINSKALVEHDVQVGDHCHISTASVLNGGVVVKENTFFGSNATSRQEAVLEGFVKAGSISK